jgi:7-cyano-7-deazaguanine synthase
VAQIFDVNKHSVVDIDLAQFGGSALTDDVKVPKDRDESDMTDIPVTYVPARNTVLLSMALAWAETLDTTDIFIGVNALDYSGYPDCRPEFIESFERMANLATKMGVLGEKFKIHTPLINLTKAEIVKKGIELNVDYGMTSSCYDPNENGNPCGRCDACILRLKGFKEAGISDPLIYPD